MCTCNPFELADVRTELFIYFKIISFTEKMKIVFGKYRRKIVWILTLDDIAFAVSVLYYIWKSFLCFLEHNGEYIRLSNAFHFLTLIPLLWNNPSSFCSGEKSSNNHRLFAGFMGSKNIEGLLTFEVPDLPDLLVFRSKNLF